MASQFYVRRQEKVIGPVAGIKLKQAVAAGTVLPADQVSDSPDGPWHFVADVPPLNTSPTPPSDPVESQLQQPTALEQEEAERRQRVEEEAWQSVEREWTAFPDDDAASTFPPVSFDFSPDLSGVVSPKRNQATRTSNSKCTTSHSGAIPLPGLLATLGYSFLATVVLAFIYTGFVIFCPFVYVSFFATAIFGAGIGAAVGWMALLTHVRNNAFVRATALLFCFLGIYVEWSVTSMILFGTPLASAFDSSSVLAAIENLYHTGSWNLQGFVVSGIPLVIVWITELSIIIWSALASVERHLD